MVFIANPDGADLVLNRGDRLGALVPAAAQTRSCSLCAFVDTDAFVNDLTTRDVCGTLLPAGPMACRRCDAGPEDVAVRLFAGCAECKGRVHSVHANNEKVDPKVHDPDGYQEAQSSQGLPKLESKRPEQSVTRRDLLLSRMDQRGRTPGNTLAFI